MKLLKFSQRLLLCLLSVLPLSASATHAVCPGQEVTVFFVNGVYAERHVEAHTRALKTLIQNEGVSLDCVHFVALTNHDESFNLDLLEATIQKSREVGVDFLHGVGMLLRSVTPDNWFLDGVIDAAYSRNAIGRVNDADLDEHMVAYRTALNSAQRIILTCHSQGCLYTQEAYFRMTELERGRAQFVDIVTPTAEVPNAGPNTRLYEDGIAELFFVAAILPNIGNEEKCIGNTVDRWTCHGMETSYLHGTKSRTKIVDDIIALLPQETPLPPGKGRVKGRVIDRDTGEPLAGVLMHVSCYDDPFNPFYDGNATTDNAGAYNLVAEQCAHAFVEGFKIGARGCVFSPEFALQAGQTYIKDLDFSFENCPQPS